LAKMKSTTVFVCQQCGFESPKWLGRCVSCNTWNSMVEETVIPASSSSRSLKSAEIKQLSEVVMTKEQRILSEIEEFDRVLGGGLVEGSLVLVGGDPGIGKSTLALQAAWNYSKMKKVLYVSGEESDTQIKMRADRLGIKSDGLYFLGHTDVDEIIASAKNAKVEIIIIDSIQTMECSSCAGGAGSVSQVRESCMRFMSLAKNDNIAVIIIGHVTKDGNIAGPRILEHMVDCVLYFEGERLRTYRILRAVKNRFGSTNEIGVFEMDSDGLHEVKNPSSMMLSGRRDNTEGSSVICTMEGSRPIMAEIQVLITPTGFGTPRRMVSGLDYNRMVMILAVIEKKLRLSIQNQDVYINIAGGMKINETVVDLPLVLAIVSGIKNIPVKEKAASVGEVGLTGELRFVSHMEKRLTELEKMGFEVCIIPKANMPVKYNGKLKLYAIDNISEVTGKIGEIIYGN